MNGGILSCIPQKILKSQETFQDSLITSSSCYACNFSPIYNFVKLANLIIKFLITNHQLPCPRFGFASVVM